MCLVLFSFSLGSSGLLKPLRFCLLPHVEKVGPYFFKFSSPFFSCCLFCDSNCIFVWPFAISVHVPDALPFFLSFPVSLCPSGWMIYIALV